MMMNSFATDFCVFIKKKKKKKRPRRDSEKKKFKIDSSFDKLENILLLIILLYVFYCLDVVSRFLMLNTGEFIIFHSHCTLAATCLQT